MCGVSGVQGLSGGVPHASGHLSDLVNLMSLQQQFAQSQKVRSHPGIGVVGIGVCSYDLWLSKSGDLVEMCHERARSKHVCNLM